MRYTNRRSFLGQSGVTMAAALISNLQLRGESWPQWRGPARTGRIDGESNWPDNFDALDQRWSVSMGPSYSGPLIDENMVVVTEWVDQKFERVHGIALDSGKKLWQAEWPGSMTVPFFAASNGSWIRSTPVLAENYLIVGGMRDLLVCLDRHSGNVVWTNDLHKTQQAPLPAFGFVCSPLVDADAIYAQAGGGIVKLAIKTGEVIWTALQDGGGMNGSAFSSPVLTTLQGERQLVVQSRTHLSGLNLEKGDVLWTTEVPAFRGMNILTPTVSGDAIFTSSYGGGSFCYDIRREGDGSFQVQQRWQNRVQGYMSSPILYEDHIYLHLRNQRFTCLDFRDGSQKWSSKPFGKYCSLIAKGKLILGLDAEGDLLLMEANPDEFRLVDRKQVADDAWAHLALVDRQLVVRSLDRVSCYHWG